MTSEGNISKVCGDDGSVLDILFIHGLTGDPVKTWTSADNEYWPRWIDDVFPNVSVYALGYPASLFEKRAKSEMNLHERACNFLEQLASNGVGEKPIAIVTHSLGGILAKEMLRTSNECLDSGWRRIAENTRLVVFMATPHTGASLASVVKRFVPHLSSTFVDLLANRDGYLTSLNQSYRDLANSKRIKTVPYHEKFKTSGMVLLVPADSADPGVGRLVPIDADHTSICKPADRKAPIFKSLCRHIKNTLKESSAREPVYKPLTSLGSGSKAQSSPSNTEVWDLLSFFGEEKKNKLDGFTGRQWTLQEVKTWLISSNVPRTMLIEAGPGFGKSAIAARIIDEFQTDERFVAYHFCIAKAPTTLNPRRLCLSLRTQLAGSGLLELVQEQYQTLGPTLFEDLVAGPLRAQATSKKAPQILIVVDSLDEAAEFASPTGITQTILDISGVATATLPQNVRLLFTARPDHSDRFAGTVGGRKLKIDDPKFSQNNRADITEYTKLRWEKSTEIQASVRASERFEDQNEFAAKLAEGSKGNFLYARLLLDDIEKNGNVLKAFDQLPEGLDQLYRTFLEQRQLGRKWRGANAEFAGTLAAARAPFDRDQLWAYANEGDRGLTRQDTNDFLEDAGQFIDTEEVSPRKRYRFHHLSFSEFLVNVETAFWIDPESPHGRIGRKASRSYWNRRSYKGMDEYAKNWALYHLQRARQWDEFITLLSEAQFMDGQLAENRRDRVLEEVFEVYKATEADANAADISDRLLSTLVMHMKRLEALGDRDFRPLVNDYYRGATPNIYRRLLEKHFEVN